MAEPMGEPEPCLTQRTKNRTSGLVVNDIHSQMNATRVASIVEARSIEDVLRVLHGSRKAGLAVSIAAGRHSMGGQQFGTGTILIDTRGMNRFLGLDRKTGIATMEAGIQWPELINRYLLEQEGASRCWGIAQKQTGADRLAIGGALSANAHGRGLTLRPIVDDVESFEIACADGQVRNCSRTEHSELFSLAIGGYGLFGVITTVRLRLRPRQKLERIVEIRESDGLIDAFERRVRDGYLYGDFQFETDETSPTFLTRGVLACYRPVPNETPVPDTQSELAYEDWMRLLHLAHVDKAQAFDRYVRHYVSTTGQVYWTDTNQLSLYPEGYHHHLDVLAEATVSGSEMITELYVPRDEIETFLGEAAIGLEHDRANVIYGTIRLIERDRDTFLPWAREPYACIVMNLHVEHTRSGIENARRSFRRLIDLALGLGGNYYLTYHRWATRGQLLRGYPQFPEFLRLKRKYDPQGRFQSDWYRHQSALLA